MALFANCAANSRYGSATSGPGRSPLSRAGRRPNGTSQALKDADEAEVDQVEPTTSKWLTAFGSFSESGKTCAGKTCLAAQGLPCPDR